MGGDITGIPAIPIVTTHLLITTKNDTARQVIITTKNGITRRVRIITAISEVILTVTIIMTASLAYIHGDYKLAHDAIGHALKSGDRHASTRQLKQIIGRKSFRDRENGHLQNDHGQEPDNEY